MLTIARRCVPFTPYEKDLASATVALVSATGVYASDQEPFPPEDPGDATYRIIPAETESASLRIAHHHFYGFTTKQTCHRSVANLAREIESRGVPTIIISASSAATESVRPPRAMTFGGSGIGRIVGRAGEREKQKAVVRTALEMFTHDTPPGRVVSKQVR